MKEDVRPCWPVQQSDPYSLSTAGGCGPPTLWTDMERDFDGDFWLSDSPIPVTLREGRERRISVQTKVL